MKVLLVFAHPEPRSLNGALRDVAIDELKAQGHEVRVTDLYAQRWTSEVDRADFLNLAPQAPLGPAAASKEAFAANALTDDVKAEIEKLLWADALILQFPLWWFGMPAILKGWVDRVFAYGFAYGVGAHGGERWGDRYGEGALSGRRAMLSVTIGGRAPHYGKRGVNGRLDDLLWPIQHGVLFYPGMAVMPPFVIYQSDKLSETEWPGIAQAYKRRLAGLFSDQPIPFRTQNGGHYDGRQVL